MGLRDKIKDAMHSDREREGTYNDSNTTPHDAKYGSTTHDAKYGTTTTGTTTDGRDYGTTYQDNKYDNKLDSKLDNSRTTATSTSGYGYGHRNTDSAVDFGDQPYTKDDGINRTSNTQGDYWGNMGQGRNSPPRKTDTLNTHPVAGEQSRLHHKDLPLRPDQQASATSTLDDTRYDNRATTGATGGTYNTVAGAGSRDYDNKAALGTAGVAGAGLAAGHRNRDTGLGADQQYQAGGGVPQSSMLDPYKAGPGANHRVGPHDSDVANKLDPRIDSDLDGSRKPIGSQNRSVATSGMASGGMGPGHFGPGHDGAKVVHTCVGCGLDNDISQYFRKDATYRMN